MYNSNIDNKEDNKSYNTEINVKSNFISKVYYKKAKNHKIERNKDTTINKNMNFKVLAFKYRVINEVKWWR